MIHDRLGHMDDPKHKHGRFFDAWSRFYRRTPLGLELRRIQRVAIEQLGVAPGERVLDVGCGPGDGAQRLIERGANAVGLDYSQGMLESAQVAPGLAGRLVRGDAGRLPFRDGAFDHLLCTHSFHHYPEHLAALKEMRRVLRAGGKLVLVDPRKGHLFAWLAIDVFERAVFGLREVRLFSPSQWEHLLREAGFSAATVSVGPAWRPVAWAEVFVEATA
jgi:ubiquinone/menaquinone biosynthesis C-methylase UbiE